nr:helix-turn-helix transcriptional regulator [Micromonospora sp. DSM 115978]
MAASPTVRRRRLGIELRRLREEAGIRIETVAQDLECSMSRVSRIETGKAVARVRDVRDMLGMYGMTDEQRRDFLFALAREAQEQGWWERYDKILPPGLNTYIGLEAEAVVMRNYEVQFIPGLLQTREYMVAVYQSSRHWPAGKDPQHWIDARLVRQERLADEHDPLAIWAVIDEAALRRPVGGAEVMRAQLRHVVAMADRPNVTIQVLPMGKGGDAGLTGQFIMLEFPRAEHGDVVFVDTPVDTIYFEKPAEIRSYRLAYDRLMAASLDPAESTSFIEKVAHELR